MQITIVDAESGNLTSCQVDASTHVADLKAILEAETGVPIALQQIYVQSRVLGDGETLGPSGVAEGDVLQMFRRPDQQQRMGGGDGRVQQTTQGEYFSHMIQNPMEAIRQFKRDAASMAHLKYHDVELHDAVRDEAVPQFVALITRRKKDLDDRKAQEDQLMALYQMDTMDPEVQRKIEDHIRQKNVEESYQNVLDNSPELAVGRVCMLYVHLEVNGIMVKSFIDSGAQMTIVTQEFAERCGLTRLIDHRFQGMAVGVGSSKIIGVIHQAPLKVGGQHIASSITVLEQKSGPPFIFGLDNLRRHQCNIDLKSNELVFGSCSIRLPFLSEAEVEKEFGSGQAMEGSLAMEEGNESKKRPAEEASGAPTPRSTNAPGPAPVAPGPASVAPGATSSLPKVIPEKIKDLMALGFDRALCENALRMAGGNVDLAAAGLMGL